MKNMFGVMSVLAVALSCSVAFASDADKKAALHQIFLAEKLMNGHFVRLRKNGTNQRLITVGPDYSILVKKSLQPIVDEVRSACDTCVYLEYFRRAGKNPFIELSPKVTSGNTDISGDEYYSKNCPQELYRSLSDEDLETLVKGQTGPSIKIRM